MSVLHPGTFVSRLAVCACLSIAVAAGTANSQEPTDEQRDACAARYASAVQSHYENVNDFAASFEQKTRSVTLGNASLGADAPSTGSVQFKKPGKMRWRYETPMRSQVISDGKILWIYDEGAKEVQRLPVTEGYLTGAALEFLLGDGKILDEFDVEVAACAADNATSVDLTLRPRRPASYEYLTLRANPTNGEIMSTGLIDLFGNRTDIAFHGAQSNLNPPDATFSFEPPEGVQVIDLTSGF